MQAQIDEAVDEAVAEIKDEYLVMTEEELNELPALVAELPVSDPERRPPGTLTPVRLESVLTEVGVLELWCIEEDGDQRWKLELDLRAAETDAPAPAESAAPPTDEAFSQ